MQTASYSQETGGEKQRSTVNGIACEWVECNSAWNRFSRVQFAKMNISFSPLTFNGLTSSDG